MPLREEHVKTGAWLFRRRSYVPLFLLLIVFLGISQFYYPGETQEKSLTWDLISIGVTLLGLFTRILTIGFTPRHTSGTNTGGQVAAVVNTTGIYSQVRHPLYLGNFLMWMGIFLFFRTWWLSVIIGLLFWIYYERIMFTEEEYLRDKFGDDYVAWAGSTPAFVPRFKQWRKPALSFSFRKAIKNEYQSTFAILVCSALVRFAADSYIAQRAAFDKSWLTAVGIGLILFLTLRTLKKKTRLLEEEGR